MRRNKRKRITSRITVHALALILLGCLAQIDIRTEPGGNQLVVSGQISTIADRNLVQLGRTAETGRLPIPLEGASVTLFDDAGKSYIYAEDHQHPGDYRLNDFTGIPGGTYVIQVVLPTGEVYESTPEQMPESTATDSIYYEILEKEFVDLDGTPSTLRFIDIYADSHLSNETSRGYFRWLAEECYVLRPTDFPDPFGSVPPPCYVIQKADPQHVTLVNGTELNGSTFNNILVASRQLDRSFYDRHYFTVYNSSLTAEAYEYWRKVNIVANQVGSVFDTPPAAIIGNIFKVGNTDETALGYFQAVNHTYNRIFLVAGDIPFSLNYQPCTFDPNRSYTDYPGECLDCLTLRNSSYVRPPWF